MLPAFRGRRGACIQRKTSWQDEGGRTVSTYRASASATAGSKRIDLGLSPLQPNEPEGPSSPVDLVEPQSGNFAAPHAVERQQQQNCAITDIPWPIGVNIGQHSLDVRPIRGIWQGLLLIEPGSSKSTPPDGPGTTVLWPRSARMRARLRPC